jgi:hypothetical protein
VITSVQYVVLLPSFWLLTRFKDTLKPDNNRTFIS